MRERPNQWNDDIRFCKLMWNSLYRLFKDLLIYSVLDKLFTSFVHHLEEIKYLCLVGVVLFDFMSVIIRFRQRTENEG